MAPSKLQKAIGAVKDQTSISLAKVSSSATISDLEVAIVKATRHEEFPADEKHIREILSLTRYSRSYVAACVATISRRLTKTGNWVVALKTLMLVHRLLVEGDPVFEQEIFFATRRGIRFLNMSDFRDTSRSNSWDFSAFVRTYALYLDEQLEFKMHVKRGKRGAATNGEDQEEEVVARWRGSSAQNMKIKHIFSRTQRLMRLLERFLACCPTGAAKHNRMVFMALYAIVKESFHIYYNMTEMHSILIERFMGLEVADCVKVYEIFSRISNQFDDLDAFYGWCKNVGIARSSEYPDVDKITQKKLDLMDEYMREKSMVGHRREKSVVNFEQRREEEDDRKSELVVEEDMNQIKALPPLEGFPEKPEKEEEEEEVRVDVKEEKEADLLNLGEDAVTCEEHGDRLALALFDGVATLTNDVRAETTRTAWEPFKDTDNWEAWEPFKDTDNWETALVQSASQLQNQQASLPGGFDTMLLDGMYQQGAAMQAMAPSGYMATGSASSIAINSAGRPAMLALPAPPKAAGPAMMSTDPFEASLPVPPPNYVQIPEMEKKHILLVQEQLMWQQYSRDGMPGQIGFTNIQQPNPYTYMGVIC